jgi:cytochrome P450
MPFDAYKRAVDRKRYGCVVIHVFGQRNVHALLAEIRRRATLMLAAELRQSGAADDVAAEMDRILYRLLKSVEQAFDGQ